MATNAQLEARIKALEAGSTVDLTAIEARLTALESLTCPQEARIAAIEAAATAEAAAQDVLEADHVPSV